MISTTNIKYLLFIPTALLLLSGCLKKKEYPSAPVIEFNGFNAFKNVQGKDSAAVVVIHYTDGEGDIGLTQADTIAPFEGIYYYNCFLEYYEKQHGVWIKPALSLPFYYRIPPLLDNGQQAVDGTIEISLSAPYFSPSAFDTIKFSAKIVDHALHESNTIETPEIVVVK